MADLWVVDSSAWIFALRSRPFPPIQCRVDQLLSEGRVLLTGLIEMELLGGTRSDKEFSDLKTLLDGLLRISIREADFVSAARMVFRLRRLGYTVPSTHALIAQQAQRARAGIVHADYDFVPLCREFKIEQEDFSRSVDGA